VRRHFTCLAQYSALIHKIARIAPGRAYEARSYLKLSEIQIINYSQRSHYSDSLRIGGSGDRIPVGVILSAPFQPGPGAHSAYYTMGTESFLGLKRPGRNVIYPPHLTQRLKKE